MTADIATPTNGDATAAEASIDHSDTPVDLPEVAYDHPRPEYQEEEILRELYVDRGWSQYDIADFFGVCQQTISNWIRYHDLSRPKHGTFVVPDTGPNTAHRPRYRAYVDGEQRWIYCSYLAALANGADPDCVFSDDTEVHHRLPTAVAVDVPENVEVLDKTEHRQLKHHSDVEDPADADTASDPSEVGIDEFDVPLSAVEGLHRSTLELSDGDDETPASDETAAHANAEA